ncbi:MAG TPA: hypothetical protein VFS56_01425 [Gemmatimonadaceae bacterium]|nr:hypothetical protein [Gemmatimonadaceae bacterium]
MDDRAHETDAKSQAEYAVGGSPVSDRPKTRYALFFTHGMGQPIPFETIDQVAKSLRDLDARLGHDNPKPVGRTVKSGDDWLNRIELRLKAGDDAVEVHLYEGYWAPLTEGRASARNVIGFLTGAGLNGLRHTKGRFRRWLFGKYPVLSIPVRTVFFLLTALATVVALVAMNSAVAVVVGGLAVIHPRPPWLSENLFADLTTTFNIVVTIMGLFGAALGASVLTRRLRWPRKVRTAWSVLTAVVFAVAVLVIVLAGAAIPFMFYGHLRDLAGGSRFAHLLADREIIEAFNAVFDATALRLALVAAAFVAARWIWRILVGLLRDMEDRKTALLTIASAVVFLGLVGAVALLVDFFLDTFSANAPPGSVLARHAAWPLLVAASIYIRLILIQFVGDVAIYVMPYKLDAFNDLRREIKQRVYQAAKAVYSQRDYDRVIIVGHSLGSVIAYDALNMLILEDPGVADRTPLFLTFGSPLDKTAFIFAVQARGTSEAREALAGSVQPLIQDYARRPAKWINVWSPWDIISGRLDLYDLPPHLNDFPAGTLARRVRNVRDEEATTLLIAHTEYWKNPLLARTIYDEIAALSPSAPRP